MTINSLVDICVRSGDLDRAYNLLKNPTLFTPSPPPTPPAAPGAGGGWAGAVDEVVGETGAADTVGSARGGDGEDETTEPAPELQEEREAAATAATATGGSREGEAGAWRGVGLVRPSVEAFTSVLTGFAGVGDKDRALAVFQQVRQSNHDHPVPVVLFAPPFSVDDGHEYLLQRCLCQAPPTPK